MSDDLTTAQVAARYHVTPANVRLWCKRGLFPNAREVRESRGSVWRIPEKDLKGFARPKRTGRPPKAKPAAEAGAKLKAAGRGARGG